MSKPTLRRVRVRKLKGSVVIGGFSTTDFPVLCWQDSGIDETVLGYCHTRAAFHRRKPSTIEQECYILFDWLNTLARQGKSCRDASQNDYLLWDSDKQSTQDVSIARVHRKREVVWSYYEYLRSHPKLGPETAGFFKSISERAVSWNGAESWSMKLRRETNTTVRKPVVPSDDEVQSVMEGLGDQAKPFLAERNFLIGQVEARIGLRAMGAEGLTIRSLDTMLEREGIHPSGGSVGALVSNKEEQMRIRRALTELARKGRSVLSARVIEKGGKQRDVEVPLDLARRLLDHVWVRRAALVASRRGAARRHRDALFLSWKHGSPLTRGAIKDLVKEAFVAANVRGSGHALRAYYLTTKAVALIQEARRKFGNNYSIEDIYTELAELAGHRHRKTLAAYIDVARLREAALRDL